MKEAKQILCKNYMGYGRCVFGDKCHFAHGEKDLDKSNVKQHSKPSQSIPASMNYPELKAYWSNEKAAILSVKKVLSGKLAMLQNKQVKDSTRRLMESEIGFMSAFECCLQDIPSEYRAHYASPLTQFWQASNSIRNRAAQPKSIELADDYQLDALCSLVPLLTRLIEIESGMYQEELGADQMSQQISDVKSIMSSVVDKGGITREYHGRYVVIVPIEVPWVEVYKFALQSEPSLPAKMVAQQDKFHFCNLSSKANALRFIQLARRHQFGFWTRWKVPKMESPALGSELCAKALEFYPMEASSDPRLNINNSPADILEFFKQWSAEVYIDYRYTKLIVTFSSALLCDQFVRQYQERLNVAFINGVGYRFQARCSRRSTPGSSDVCSKCSFINTCASPFKSGGQQDLPLK